MFSMSTPTRPEATIVADLADAAHIPADAFDCIILTQTLHLIFDVRAAVATVRRILAPGGVVLATVPGISQVDRGRVVGHVVLELHGASGPTHVREAVCR